MTAIASHYVDTSPSADPPSAVHAKPVARPSTMAAGLTRGRTAVRILDAVSARFGVTWEQILSKRRTGHLANARHVAAWLMRQSGMSYPEIGKALGGRDHTTAMNSVARVEEQRATSGIQYALDELLQETASGTMVAAPANGARCYELEGARAGAIELVEEPTGDR